MGPIACTESGVMVSPSHEAISSGLNAVDNLRLRNSLAIAVTTDSSLRDTDFVRKIGVQDFVLRKIVLQPHTNNIYQ